MVISCFLLLSIIVSRHIYCSHIYSFSFSFSNFLYLTSQSIPSHSKTLIFFYFQFHPRTKPLFYFSGSSFSLCHPTYSQRPFLILIRSRHSSLPPSPQAPSNRDLPTVTSNTLISLDALSFFFSLCPILNRASLHAPLRGFESRVVSLIEVVGSWSRKWRGTKFRGEEWSIRSSLMVDNGGNIWKSVDQPFFFIE